MKRRKVRARRGAFERKEGKEDTGDGEVFGQGEGRLEGKKRNKGKKMMEVRRARSRKGEYRRMEEEGEREAGGVGG